MRFMDNEQNLQPEEQNPVQEKKEYHPRPAWQIWAARVGLVIMIVSVVLYYIHIATGGMR